MSEKKKYTTKSGKFAKGNPGKPKGALSYKSIAWDRIGEYLVGEGAEKYLSIISKLDDDKFAREFQAILEYFKPKQQRTEIKGDVDTTIHVKFKK